jgi:hypothetical protein
MTLLARDVLQFSHNTTVLVVIGILCEYRCLVFRWTSLLYTLYANKTKSSGTQALISLAMDTSPSTETMNFPE